MRRVSFMRIKKNYRKQRKEKEGGREGERERKKDRETRGEREREGVVPVASSWVDTLTF